MKRVYENLQMEILFLLSEDIVTVSYTYGSSDTEEGSQKDPFFFG